MVCDKDSFSFLPLPALLGLLVLHTSQPKIIELNLKDIINLISDSD